jgi:hypothetical protein
VPKATGPTKVVTDAEVVWVTEAEPVEGPVQFNWKSTGAPAVHRALIEMVSPTAALAGAFSAQPLGTTDAGGGGVVEAQAMVTFPVVGSAVDVYDVQLV